MSCLGKTVLWILVALGMFVATVLGTEMRGELSLTAVLAIVAVILAAIVLWGRQKNGIDTDEKTRFAARNKVLNNMVVRYNAEVQQLKSSYAQEEKGTTQKELLRKSYEQRYLLCQKKYNNERKIFLNSWDKANTTPLRNFWQWAIVVGFISILLSCSFSLGLELDTTEATKNSLMEQRMWSADNVPMPHMHDHSQYVSNPDSILSPIVVDSINATLGRLDDVLGIESAMIIVGHIQDDDPIAMVRGIYQRYGVGRNNRGLVIVVGYLDHSYFIAPGRNLEGDLTDLDCNHLAQNYLIPSMRAEQPDSGMLYLARGIYSLMAGKDMPVMTSLTGNRENDDTTDTSLYIMGLYMLLLVGWGFYGAKMSDKVGWSTMKGVAHFMSNPFMAVSAASGLSGSHRSRSSGSSWGGRSGGYGGGSWGGGGSGGRW